MASAAQARLSPGERRVIERWIERLRSELDIESVWLFGSRARGAGSDDSDIDLLVITRGDPARDRQRVWALIDEAAREQGANPAAYVPHTWTAPGSRTARRSGRSSCRSSIGTA